MPRSRIIRFGPFEADFDSGELRRDGVKLRLQAQPFQILTMLLEHPREVVTREQIREKLWPQDTFVDFDHSLGTAINKLRSALHDSAETPQFVETLPKRGYRFIGEITPLALPRRADNFAQRVRKSPTLARGNFSFGVDCCCSLDGLPWRATPGTGRHSP
jgi:DNA-binding winged helix-turn-helix (wHTH) protein